VEVYKHPNGTYYVRFKWQGKVVNRSCGARDRRKAMPIAKNIRLDYIEKHAAGKPTSAVRSKDRKLKDVIKLYKKFILESDKAPSPDTARKYVQQLTRWIKRLDAHTISEFRAAFQDYSLKKENARRLRDGDKPLQKGGYASSVRSAAAIFSKEALKYYKRHGYQFENPLSGEVPKATFEKFIVPPCGLEFIKTLFRAAEEDLSEEKQMYPIFLLCLGAGLRAQEATHVKWCDIQDAGIIVRSDEATHQTKNRKARTVPAGPTLKHRLLKLKPVAAGMDDFVAPALRRSKINTAQKKYKQRCDRALKKLNKWLRTQGVTSELTTHPCHYLRKLFGASILTRYANGLQLAKKYLGHQSTDITERIYVDLLETPEVDILPEL
jgi:integrase